MKKINIEEENTRLKEEIVKSQKGNKEYGTGIPEKSPAEWKAEAERLQKENRRLKEDAEILQDALGFFAKSRKK